MGMLYENGFGSMSKIRYQFCACIQIYSVGAFFIKKHLTFALNGCIINTESKTSRRKPERSDHYDKHDSNQQPEI